MIDKNYVTLEGVGHSSILYLADSSNISVVVSGDGTTTRSNIKIADLKIDGNDTNNAGDNCHGISFNKVTYSEIEGVWVYDVEDNGMRLDNSTSYNNIAKSVFESNSRGICIDGESRYNIVSDNDIKSNSSYGIEINYSNPTSDNNIITNNIMDSNGAGIALDDYIDYTIISGNNIYNSTGAGISMKYSNYTSVTGNVIENYGGMGVWIDGADRNTITGNTIIDDNSGNGIYLDSGGSQYGNIISSNHIYVPDGHCIFLESLSSHNTITANVLEGDGASDSSDDGIYIEGDSDNNIISSNRIRNKDRYGINLSASTIDGTYLVGNEITDSGTNDINDVGT
ncbi:MAG: right-handed parallel beta-helix repeat-containing protein, partial [Gammaproteobacteria bacterium]|nr:right-handed parallel beta-helix repeat-containing protein [Gammaproteobacteria bacterium]